MSGLAGRRVLITRDAEEAARTAEAVAGRGGIPVVFPCIAFAAPADPEALRRAVARWREYDRVVVTSPRGARVLLERLDRLGEWPEAAERGRFFAVGEATARVLRRGGLRDVRVPGQWQGEGLLEALLADGAARGRTLLVRAEEGRDVVPDGIRAAGGAVDVVAAYRTVRVTHSETAVEGLLAGTPPDLALFFSPSAFEAFMAIGGASRVLEWLGTVRVVAVGAVTAGAMERAGVVPSAVAVRPVLEQVLDAAEEALSRGPSATMSADSGGNP